MDKKEVNVHNIRCIVADMDGTLLNDEKQLDNGIRDVITQLKEKGIVFTLASGRNVQIMKSFIQELQIDFAYIVNNGACIYRGDECLFEQTMEEEDMAKALSIYESESISYVAYTSEAIYVHGAQEPLELFLNRLKGKSTLRYDCAGVEIAKHHVFKVVAVNENPSQMKRVQARIHATCESLQCLRSEDEIYTITHKDTSKGIALKRIMEDAGIDLKDVLVFGDNFNDVSMFQVAGIAVAMENAQNDVLQHADMIALDNNHQGVSRFIKEHILK
ncbi:Cof-type HAD-IIB family hydrolase [Amedibacillus sp. YH-ame6]